jgi:hypothetical protein
MTSATTMEVDILDDQDLEFSLWDQHININI